MRLLLPLALAVALLVAAPAAHASPASPIAAAAARRGAATTRGAARRGKAKKKGRARALRCPRGTVAFGSARAPQGCARPPASAGGRFDALNAALALAPRASRKAKGPSARVRKLARQLASGMLQRVQAGEPALRVVRAGAARAAGLAPASLPHGIARVASGAAAASFQGLPSSAGRSVSVKLEAGGAEAVFDAGRGVTTRIDVQTDENGDATSATMEVTDRRGSGLVFGMGEKGPPTPTCPTGAGDLPSRLRQEVIVGTIAVDGRKRYRRVVKQVIEGRWHGYVAVSARAERFDVALRGALEVRAQTESTATGKVLKREGTRTFRTALDKRGVPIGTDPASLLREMRLRGPKGRYLSSGDVREATTLVAFTAVAVGDVISELHRGDRRWYDDRACATIDFTSSPERVAKGGRADWEVVALGADGQKVADATWAPASSCGTLTASGTRGPSITLAVVDDAGRWGPEPYQPACATAEVTTTGGRPRPFDHTIFPIAKTDWRIEINVAYREDMGPGVVPTEMTGSGTVAIRHGEVTAQGDGQWSAREWAAAVDNTCGQDMMRGRDVAGRAVVGAQLNDDGTISVAFTALERPLNMAWIEIFPLEGGRRTVTNEKPFCGEPRRAKTTADITVAVTRVERPWGQ
ncbi:hypothetical protein [Conexibacter arvalis]|uniref:Uncharacterized protein n=1 Tax=Conexibacter arvalis TaxID=912552 RepID=A0A840IHL8_9ACTN|nr:hypothetical protein [Conexibacter arvalis]MBB4663448.1 hypothetical protein [Conexibacter arvalis]